MRRRWLRSGKKGDSSLPMPSSIKQIWDWLDCLARAHHFYQSDSKFSQHLLLSCCKLNHWNQSSIRKCCDWKLGIQISLQSLMLASIKWAPELISFQSTNYLKLQNSKWIGILKWLQIAKVQVQVIFSNHDHQTPANIHVYWVNQYFADLGFLEIRRFLTWTGFWSDAMSWRHYHLPRFVALFQLVLDFPNIYGWMRLFKIVSQPLVCSSIQERGHSATHTQSYHSYSFLRAYIFTGTRSFGQAAWQSCSIVQKCVYRSISEFPHPRCSSEDFQMFYNYCWVCAFGTSCLDSFSFIIPCSSMYSPANL